MTILILIMTITIYVAHVWSINKVRIPKKIWTYWHDKNNIPDIVMKCIDTWRSENSDYEITILDNEKIKSLCNFDISKLNIVDIFHARQADIARLLIIQKYGGIWIDASIICTKSLKWIHDLQQKNNFEFVGYTSPQSTNNKYPIIENWFFAAPPKSQFVTDWLSESIYMTTFSGEQAYIDHIKNTTDTDIQNLPDLLPYLVIHLCAAVVQQRQKSTTKKYKMYLIRGTRGPLKYLNDNEWDTHKALESLCFSNTPLIKLIGGGRKYIEDNLFNLKCNNDANKNILHVLSV